MIVVSLDLVSRGRCRQCCPARHSPTLGATQPDGLIAVKPWHNVVPDPAARAESNTIANPAASSTGDRVLSCQHPNQCPNVHVLTCCTVLSRSDASPTLCCVISCNAIRCCVVLGHAVLCSAAVSLTLQDLVNLWLCCCQAEACCPPCCIVLCILWLITIGGTVTLHSCNLHA